MKIDGLTPTANSQRLDTAKSRRKGTASKTGSAASSDSNVELTGISSRLQELEAYLSGFDGVDMPKVEAMRQAIAEGRYGINEDVIAERLVGDIVEDLRRQVKK